MNAERMDSRRCQPRGAGILALAALVSGLCGCASRQYSHILASDDKDLVGSHAAGAATWNPLVEESVARLLSRCPPDVRPVGFQMHGQEPIVAAPATICFVGIENKSAEEIGDFKDQLFEQIDSQINAGSEFRGISRRVVQAALLETRLRPDSLFLPGNRDVFAAALGKAGSPVDFLLFATITSGTTDRNKTSQRDYTLTMEMVNVHSGDFIKESAKIRKGYSKSRTGKWWNYGIFDQADG
ncbi:MAG: penicillin-binding protein activator LpoB [Planctomycetota bacterium]